MFLNIVAKKGSRAMQRRKTFSTMEIVLICVLLGSLLLSFIQARQQELREASQ